jgi:hypothetical protein
MRRIVRLTESDLIRLVKRVIKENEYTSEINVGDNVYVPKQDMIYKVVKKNKIGIIGKPISSKEKGDEMDFSFDEIEKLHHQKTEGNEIQLNKDKDYGWVIYFPNLDVEKQEIIFGDDKEEANKKFNRAQRLLGKGFSVEEIYDVIA